MTADERRRLGIPLTADERERIREAWDAHIRAQRERLINAGDLETCSGCGCDTDLRTRGCKTCGDRHRKWEARKDPSWYERQRARARQRWAEDPEYRDRRRAQQKRRRSGQAQPA